MTLSSQNKTPMVDSGQRETDILNRCLEAIRSNRSTIQDCIEQYPEFIELESLLDAALAVEELPKVALNRLSKVDIRRQVLAQFDAQPVKKPVQTPTRRSMRGWLRPVIATLTALIVLFGGGGTLIHAATLTVPGDTLYDLKRTTERVQLALSAGDARIATLDMIADRRLDELAILVSRKRELTPAILDDASASVAAALSAEPDASKRTTLLVKTGNVMEAAANAGAINEVTEANILLTVNKAPTPDGAKPPVVPAILTDTPTATLTATGTPTSTEVAPTDIPSVEPSDEPDEQNVTASPVPSDTPDASSATATTVPSDTPVVPSATPTVPPTKTPKPTHIVVVPPRPTAKPTQVPPANNGNAGGNPPTNGNNAGGNPPSSGNNGGGNGNSGGGKGSGGGKSGH